MTPEQAITMLALLTNIDTNITSIMDMLLNVQSALFFFITVLIPLIVIVLLLNWFFQRFLI